MAATAKNLSEQKVMGAQLSVITVFQIIASFGMHWYVVALMGAGSNTDALYTGAVFPQVFTVLIIESLTAVNIPLMAAMPDFEAEETAWALLALLFLSFGSLAVVLFFTVHWMVPLLVPGFDAATRSLTISLARVQVFGLVFGACTAPMSALLQVRHRFRVPALSLLAGLIVGWLMLMFGLKRFGIEVAALAQVTATGIPTLLLLPFVGRPRVAVWDRQVMRTILNRIKPLVFSKAYYMVSVPVDRFLASFLAPGSIVILELANRFYSAILRVLSQGILTPFLPMLSRFAHEKRWEEFRSVNRKQVLFTAVLTLPVVAGVLAAYFVVHLMSATNHSLHLGSLTGDRVAFMFLIMVYMAGLLPTAAICSALTSAFLAQGDTKTPARIGVQVFTFGFALKIAGFYVAGIKGIAMAVTLWAVLQAIIMWVVLERRTRKLMETEVPIAETAVEPLAAMRQATS